MSLCNYKHIPKIVHSQPNLQILCLYVVSHKVTPRRIFIGMHSYIPLDSQSARKYVKPPWTKTDLRSDQKGHILIKVLEMSNDHDLIKKTWGPTKFSSIFIIDSWAQDSLIDLPWSNFKIFQFQDHAFYNLKIAHFNSIFKKHSGGYGNT